MVWLFIYVLAISAYDLRTRRIPNWYTLPIIIAGWLVQFPGRADVWLASFILLSAWTSGWMGAGDVKLWMAVLWALPFEFSSYVPFMMAASFFFSGLVQILWRTVRKQSLTQALTPAAWRTIPFVLLCQYVH